MEQNYLQNDDTNNFVYDADILQIVKTGNDFCLLAEQAYSNTKENFVKEMLKITSQLYAQTINLEYPKNLPDENIQKFVSEADWTFIESSIKEKLGENNRLIQLKEPEHPEETTETEISECIADTYQTVKDFILLYELAYENSTLAGIKEYLELFHFHTGPRLLLIMSELHDILFSSEELINDSHNTYNQKNTDPNDNENTRWINNFFDED